MRRLALAAVVLVTVACGRSPQAAVPTTTDAPKEGEAQLFEMDKGFMFPIVNGARIPIENGWIEPHISPFPPHRSADIDIVVGADGAADPAMADVTMSYEMLEMAHGVTTVKADPQSAGHHLAHMGMGMYGTWRIKVQVVLDGVTSTSVFLLTGTGL